MLKATNLIGFGQSPAESGADFVTDNLQMHLDAGAAASYDSGVDAQRWFDLTANSYDWFLGAAASSGSDDPTFNGSAGGDSSSEYFSFDGGDGFLKENDDSGSFLRKIGRTDQAFTLEVWIYPVNTTNNQVIFTNAGNAGNGIRWWLGHATDGRWALSTGTDTLFDANDTNLSTSVWQQWAIAGKMDGSTTGLHVVNGIQDGTWTTNNSAFTSGDSAHKGYIGRRSDGIVRFTNGTRLAIVRVYDVALTEAQLLQNYNAQKARFGL